MTASLPADIIHLILRAESGEAAMSINPDLPADEEPSADAVRLADEMDGLYETWRDASKAMAGVCQKLIDANAARPTITRMVTRTNEWSGVKVTSECEWAVDPCDFIGACDDLADADFRHCWADNAAAFDRRTASLDRQRLAEMEDGK